MTVAYRSICYLFFGLFFTYKKCTLSMFLALAALGLHSPHMSQATYFCSMLPAFSAFNHPIFPSIFTLQYNSCYHTNPPIAKYAQQ
jgi:hypothetical protein